MTPLSLMDWLTLAGSLLGGAIAGGIYVGRTIGQLRAQVEALQRQLGDERRRVSETNQRLDMLLTSVFSHRNGHGHSSGS